VLQAAALCVNFIPQEGVCNTSLQSLESKRLLLFPFCFALSMSNDGGCSEDAVMAVEMQCCRSCRAPISSARLSRTLCVEPKKPFRSGDDSSPASRAKEIQERTSGNWDQSVFPRSPDFWSFF